MKPVYQRVIGTGFGPPYGDCLKCCVASVLDLEYESVPNFLDLDVSGFWIAAVRSAVFGPRLHNGRLTPSTHSIVMYEDVPVFDPLPVPTRPPYEFCGDMWFAPRTKREPRGEPDA